MTHLSRVILASILGNALEFYNLTLYGVLTPLFAKIYFPAASQTTSLLASVATFGVAFFFRPLGALIFGYIGDRIGRKKALSLSIVLMGLPTILIAFIPAYASIGFAATALLLGCRIFQGLCAGGEFNGATIFALEHLGKKKPGLVGGAIVGSCLLGVLLANLAASFFSLSFFPEDGWRFAFILGAIFSVTGFFLRKKVDESPIFEELKAEEKIESFPLKIALSQKWKSCLLVFSVATLDGALTYTLFGFLNFYLSVYLGASPVSASLYSLFASVVCMLACPLFGALADRFGGKETLVVSCFLVLGFSLPSLIFILSEKFAPTLIGYGFLGILVASIIGTQPLFSQGLFRPSERYTGISFSYSLGIAVGGGTTPLILTWQMNTYKNLFFPGFYLMGASILFLTTLLALTKKKLP